MVFNFGQFFFKIFDILYNLGIYLYKFLSLPLKEFVNTIPGVSNFYDTPIIGSIFKFFINLINVIFPFPILSVEGTLIFIGIGLLFLIVKQFI